MSAALQTKGGVSADGPTTLALDDLREPRPIARRLLHRRWNARVVSVSVWTTAGRPTQEPQGGPADACSAPRESQGDSLDVPLTAPATIPSDRALHHP